MASGIQLLLQAAEHVARSPEDRIRLMAQDMVRLFQKLHPEADATVLQEFETLASAVLTYSLDIPATFTETYAALVRGRGLLLHCSTKWARYHRATAILEALRAALIVRSYGHRLWLLAFAVEYHLLSTQALIVNDPSELTRTLFSDLADIVRLVPLGEECYTMLADTSLYMDEDPLLFDSQTRRYAETVERLLTVLLRKRDLVQGTQLLPPGNVPIVTLSSQRLFSRDSCALMKRLFLHKRRQVYSK